MKSAPIYWWEIVFPRPLQPEAATDRLRAVAADPRAPIIALEIRSQAGHVRYLLGSPPESHSRIAAQLGVVAVRLNSSKQARQPMMTTRRVRFTNHQRELDTAHLGRSSSELLAAVSRTRRDEEVVLQVLLGRRLSPKKQSAPGRNLGHLLLGTTPREADAETRSSLAAKTSDAGFEAVVRLGVSADDESRRRSLALSTLAALRQLATPGVDVRLRSEKQGSLDLASVPWCWTERFNVRELAAVAGLPVSDAADEDLPGLPPAHPRLLPPTPAVLKTKGLVIGEATAPESQRTRSTNPTLLRLSPEALLRHVAITGPTGTGKSVLLEHLVLDHIGAGHGAVVIEPKGDLVRALLAKIPEQRRDDIVVLDPSMQQVVGLNPLSGDAPAELRADAILHVIKDLFSADIGPRSTDILHSALLTLARTPGTSLVDIPRLLADVNFRSRLVAAVADDPLMAGFWVSWETMNVSQQNSIAAPLMNKLRYVLLRPTIRAVLGQATPRFNVADIFTRNKILLVPLPVATLGAEGSALLGSLVVSAMWTAAQSRSLIPVEERRPVLVCLDEFQNYCRLPDIEDALATSRSLGVGWVLAHQFIDQLPTSTKAAVAANVRSRIVFQLAHDDAAAVAKTTTGHKHHELTPADLMTLSPFHIYASLFAAGQVQPFASGRTLPPDDATADPQALAAASARRYGGEQAAVAGATAEQPVLRQPATSAPYASAEVRESSAASSPATEVARVAHVADQMPEVGSRRRRQREKKQAAQLNDRAIGRPISRGASDPAPAPQRCGETAGSADATSPSVADESPADRSAS